MTKIFGKITTGFLRAIFVLSRARIRNCHGQFCYVTGKNPVIVTATFRFPQAFFFAILSRETRQFSLENFGVLCHGQFFKTTAHFQKVSLAKRKLSPGKKHTDIGKARQTFLPYCCKNSKTAKRQRFLKSIRAHDIGKSAGHGKGSAELPILRHIDKARQTVLPYCRKKRQNGKTPSVFSAYRQGTANCFAVLS